MYIQGDLFIFPIRKFQYLGKYRSDFSFLYLISIVKTYANLIKQDISKNGIYFSTYGDFQLLQFFHVSWNAAEHCSNGSLQVVQIFVVSDVHLALDIAPQEKVHWCQVRRSWRPWNVMIVVAPSSMQSSDLADCNSSSFLRSWPSAMVHHPV